MTLNRTSVWAAAVLVVVAFGLPLFPYLGATDLKGDEPIYAFAIDRMLDHGDWLTPKAIPYDDAPFLEKPPLKFWVVAASMRAGMLPHDEFGYRFWDVIFGIVAFLYVLAIGVRISGIVCGLTAVLVLFTHRLLVLEHGLRSNNMEAALVLAYCGAIYHALGWVGATRRSRRWLHAIAVGSWFAFGFMMKFVAAAFLPAILVVTAVLCARWRRSALRDWAIWTASALVAAALILPWFLYQFRVHGREFWDTIFGVHIFVRFTSFLDPAHLHPWYYYLATLVHEISWSNDLTLVGAGFVLLVYRAVKERSDTAILLLVWFLFPLVMISAGTSKLYHYVYPFLAPLALGAGLVPAVVFEWAYRNGERIASVLERIWPRRRSQSLPAWLRGLFIALAVVSIAIAVITPVVGGVSLRAGGVTLFRSATVSRPIIVAVVLLMLAGLVRTIPLALVAAGLVVAAPFDAYRNVRFLEGADAKYEDRPMGTLRDCLMRLQKNGAGRGVYVHTEAAHQWRYAYYLRDAGWNMEEMADEPKLLERLFTPGLMRPVFVTTPDYDRLLQRLTTGGDNSHMRQLVTMHRVIFDDGRMLFLPDGYAACSGITGAGTRSGG
jgi:4-amino-4-deoxy-L-arabinose transferase-like glycosyltransferase